MISLSCVAICRHKTARCCHNNMTAVRHYRVSVVLVEHHAPLCNLRLERHSLLVLHVLQLNRRSVLHSFNNPTVIGEKRGNTTFKN